MALYQLGKLSITELYHHQLCFYFETEGLDLFCSPDKP